MASITYDGQSFMVDGRRIWLVSGTVCYARTPRQHWADRIHAARHAGLNTIETPVIWARHEPRQAHFDFSGDNDVRHFVELVHEAGMMCILRPGPYVGAAWDLGGLPPWLLSSPNVRLRTASPAFLEACSRYITALAQQVRDLQVTSSGRGGPIVLIQSESGWTCGDDHLAQQYLGELNRYFREAGLTVPTINANDLWQGVEGEIDCWTGSEGLLAHLRQLATVRPDQPKIVIDLPTAEPTVWGRPAAAAPTGAQVMRRLVEAMAAGGQFNLSPFHGGTNFGFSGGREGGSLDGFYTTAHVPGAPLGEAGSPGATWSAVRRVCMFASRFSRVLSNLDPQRYPVVQHPSPQPAAAGGGRSGARASEPCPPVVVYAGGVHGSVAFVFGDDSGEARSQSVTLLLPNGTSLPVEIGSESAGWCLFDARLTGRTTLDYSNLSAFAVVGKVLVVWGPAGAHGVLSINGSRLEVDVPSGREPAVAEHEGVVVVVCSPEQTDAVFVDDEAVYIGVSGLTPARPGITAQPLPHPAYKACTRISAAGEVSTIKPAPPPVARPAAPAAPAKAAPPAGRKRSGAASVVAVARAEPPPGPRLSLSHWTMAPAAEYESGESARYASINGPADLDSLGAPYGYGWYRIRLKAPPAGRHRVLFPMAGDRLHLTLDGEPAGVVGVGPGAEPEAHLSFKKGPHTLVALVENAGRFSGGLNLGQRVGLYGHAWIVSPLRLPAPKIQAGDPLDPLAFLAPQWGVHRGDATDPERLTWTFAHRNRSPVFLRMKGLGLKGLVLLNGTPIHAFDGAGIACLTIEPALLQRASTVLQVAVLGPAGVVAEHAKDLAHAVECFDGEENLTDAGPAPSGRGAARSDRKVEWAFAKWEPPPNDAFEPAAKPASRAGSGARWWKCAFAPDEGGGPLRLDLSGMTKGQVYVNGVHIGRYFVATADGKAVPPQQEYYVPRSYADRPACELMLFDEHGAAPSRVRFVTA
jgi:hypothetical protein